MQIGIFGLGKMGANMARRLARGGVRPALLNRTFKVSEELAQEIGGRACQDEQEWLNSLDSPRIVWLMLPAGDATETAIQTLLPKLKAGDVLVNGANAYYQDSERHARLLAERGVLFMDAGVSGGIWGLENGYALMVGGDAGAVAVLEPYLKILAPAPDKGWLHCGPAGSGHFVKMIHNGIEYGMMQAFAEGFALMQGKAEFNLDLAAISEMWRHGSVVRSWLLDLTADFLAHDHSLGDVSTLVADSGEGRWTVLEAVHQGIPAPVLSLALMSRFDSQGKGDFGNKMLAKMRQAFGGHALGKAT
ncbi:MAG: phosphogluconate dehydrogenase (NAD(+)-dependent, decarboxylating) [Thiobacillaceae bacterium]